MATLRSDAQTFEMVKTRLSQGEDVSIYGFGIFKVIRRAARKGRNPITGESIDIPEKTAIKFQLSNTFKREINALKF